MSGMWASMLKTSKKEAGQHITAQGRLSMSESGAGGALMAMAPILLLMETGEKIMQYYLLRNF